MLFTFALALSARDTIELSFKWRRTQYDKNLTDDQANELLDEATRVGARFNILPNDVPRALRVTSHEQITVNTNCGTFADWKFDALDVD